MALRKPLLALASAAALSAACVTTPTGPSVMALPGRGKSFAAFQQDDQSCRAWATQRIGAAPGQPISQGTASGAAIGTALGAAAGTLIGVAGHDPGAGAAIGAGTGLAVGSASGASADARAAQSLQARYDIAYVQCMYANGERVPVGPPAPRYGPPAPGRPALPPAPPPSSPPPAPPSVG